MKFLFCFPQYYGWEETGRFINEALMLEGHETIIYDDLWRSEAIGKEHTNDGLIKMVEKHNPDVLLMLKSEHIRPETLSKIHCKKILWHPDVRKHVQPWVVDKAKECDIFYTMSKGSMEEYEKELDNVKYLPEACDPAYHFYTNNVDAVYKSPINFIGTVRQTRIDMIKRIIRNKLPIKLWGSFGDDVSPQDKNVMLNSYMNKQLWREYHSYAASGSISVTWDWCPEVELSYSARIYRVMASKGLYLCRYVNGMEKVFKRGVHCDWYYNLDEMIEKLKYYLSNRDEMNKIGEQAQQLVYDEHTFTHRIRELLKDVKQL